jgi:predicted nucleotidyltransferase
VHAIDVVAAHFQSERFWLVRNSVYDKMETNNEMEGIRMVYSIAEIRDRITPVLEAYQVKKVYLFGSYARGQATDQSDIDLVFQSSDSLVHGLIKMTQFKDDLEDALEHDVDVFSLESLTTSVVKENYPRFIDNVTESEILLYG